MSATIPNLPPNAAPADIVRIGIAAAGGPVSLACSFSLEDVEQLERSEGLFSFRESLDKRHDCCGIRKVEPLSRALKGLSGWVTGMGGGRFHQGRHPDVVIAFGTS